MINKKRNMFTKIYLISFSILCFCLVIGVIYNDKSRHSLFKTICVFIIFVYYVSVAIHELAHFVTYKLFKVQMRAICFTPFCFINNGVEWKVKVNWNNIGLGGAAIPNLVVVKDDNDFIKIKKAFAYSMLVATTASIVLIIIGTILATLGYTMFNNETMGILGSFLIFVNFIIVLGCFTKSENVLGDFFAYRCFLKDDDIVTSLIYNYSKLSMSYHEIRKNNTYLREKLLNCFESKIKENIIDLDALVITTGFINEFLIDNTVLPDQVNRYINEFWEKSEQFEKGRNTEIFKNFVTRVAYYFEYTGNHELALKIYTKYISNFTDRIADKYKKIQAEQIILHKDNSDYLNKRENIKPDSFYSFYRLFDGYLADEIVLNKCKI